MAYNETFGRRRVLYKNANGEWPMYTGEARFAKLLDLIGGKWVKDERRYYLGDALSYLPDFTLHNKKLNNLIVEVKNRNYEQIKPIDFMKIERMYEKGYNLLIVRRPPTDVSFIRNDHESSNGFFYSGKYIHGVNDDSVIWFTRDPDGELALIEIGLYSGIEFIEESIQANNCEFMQLFDPEDDDA